MTTLGLRRKLSLELYRGQRRLLTKEHRLETIFWESTLRCNLKCRHCGSDCREAADIADMPIADFLRVVDSVSPYVNTHETLIIFTGGEPLMRRDLEMCGRELYRREYPRGMVTNGMLLTVGRFASLLNAGLRALTISLDGLEITHNWLRGHPDSYKRAAEAIRMVAQSGEPLAWDVVTCVNQRNFSELRAIKEKLLSFGVKQWRIFIFLSGRAAGESDSTRSEGHIRLDYGCEGFLGRYEGTVRSHFFHCRAGISVASVLADGSISACPSIRGDFIQGNIYRAHFLSVWNERYQPFCNRSWTREREPLRQLPTVPIL